MLCAQSLILFEELQMLRVLPEVPPICLNEIRRSMVMRIPVLLCSCGVWVRGIQEKNGTPFDGLDAVMKN